MLNFLQFKKIDEAAKASDDPKDSKDTESNGKFASDLAHDNPDLEFNDKQAEKDAENWLKMKYGEDLYNFKRVKNLEMDAEDVKSYSISIGDNVYSLNLRRFEGEQDMDKEQVLDTLGYDVLPGAMAPEIIEPEIETKADL